MQLYDNVIIIVQDLLCSLCTHCVPMMILNYIVFLERGGDSHIKKGEGVVVLVIPLWDKKVGLVPLKVPSRSFDGTF